MNTNKSGTYKFDPKTGKVVKVSDKVPSCSSKGGHPGGCCCHGH